LAPLHLTREQILGHRRRASALDERLPAGDASLAIAAFAGLTDSMPRAALLSIHARVEATPSDVLDHPVLAQIWGPRFSAYVVAADDVPVFTLGRAPADAAGRRRGEELADRLEAFLGDRVMTYSEAGHALGENPNTLRYAAPTGRVRIRWEGARQPTIWVVPRPAMTVDEARLELARRYLHVLGPGDVAGFSDWAGRRLPGAQATFDALAPELLSVQTPVGAAWILAADEASFRTPAGLSAPARLLPSGDAFFLLQGRDRELLVPDAAHRPLLWTPRVWPGAVVLDGEVAGTWRRAGAEVIVDSWTRRTARTDEAIEAEARSFPLPDVAGRIGVRWERQVRFV
jgi:hypothetical protein